MAKAAKTPKITREILIDAHNNGISDSIVAKTYGVSRQAVFHMKKKYFPHGFDEK